MKRLISAALALSLLGASAAAAAPYDRGDRGYNGAGQAYNRGYDNRERGDNTGGAIVAGLGILALAAILASQNDHRYHQGWYNNARGHGRYGHGYNRGYDRRW